MSACADSPMDILLPLVLSKEQDIIIFQIFISEISLHGILAGHDLPFILTITHPNKNLETVRFHDIITFIFLIKLVECAIQN